MSIETRLKQIEEILTTDDYGKLACAREFYRQQVQRGKTHTAAVAGTQNIFSFSEKRLIAPAVGKLQEIEAKTREIGSDYECAFVRFKSICEWIDENTPLLVDHFSEQGKTITIGETKKDLAKEFIEKATAVWGQKLPESQILKMIEGVFL